MNSRLFIVASPSVAATGFASAPDSAMAARYITMVRNGLQWQLSGRADGAADLVELGDRPTPDLRPEKMMQRMARKRSLDAGHSRFPG
jgi:hypothetical protein